MLIVDQLKVSEVIDSHERFCRVFTFRIFLHLLLRDVLEIIGWLLIHWAQKGHPGSFVVFFLLSLETVRTFRAGSGGIPTNNSWHCPLERFT